MKAAGASRVVALVKEDIDNEVAEFRAGFWPEEVHLDETRSFYKALGGGDEHKEFSGVTSFLATLVNPFSKSRSKGNMSEATAKGFEGNLKGEGFVQGGVYVIRQDGTAAYTFLEEHIGDGAPAEDVVEGVKAAMRGEQFNFAPRAMAGAAPGATRMTWKEWAGRSSGPEGYQIGDISRSFTKSSARCSRK